MKNVTTEELKRRVALNQETWSQGTSAGALDLVEQDEMIAELEARGIEVIPSYKFQEKKNKTVDMLSVFSEQFKFMNEQIEKAFKENKLK